jgi:peptidoglycan/xylan/chitin deacetylase (PgdA/CDA1 family)
MNYWKRLRTTCHSLQEVQMPKVFISFATEEFVTPAHNEVLIRIASILSERNIVGSFHLTGELARNLRDNQRFDVIEALRQHEIGYHSNTHGAFPFIGSVCENNSWDSAVEKLMRTEAKGILDIEKIFGKRPVYYVTEFTKAPQLIYALRSLGIDLLGFSGLPENSYAPFCWYTGSLCYTGPIMGMESPPHAGRLQEMNDEFDSLYQQEKAKGSNGVIKLFNHPYKFAYNNNIASWVSKNKIYKSYNIYTPWIVPEESLYSEEVTNHLFSEFEQLLDYILEKDDVEFLSTSQIALAYQNKLPHFISWKVFSKLLQQIDKSITWQKAGDMIFAPSEIFALMTYALKYFSNYRKLPESLPVREPLGPVALESDSLNDNLSLPIETIMESIANIDRELDFSQQLAAEIEFSGCKISLPSAYYAFAHLLKNSIPDSGNVIFQPVEPLPEIASKDYFNAQSWTKQSYPAGFTGKNICAHARLQSWTFKPAKTINERGNDNG